jgi:hypothetical protein
MFPPTLSRLIDLVFNYEMVFMETLHVFLVSVQELLFTIIYIANPAIKKVLKKAFKQLFKCDCNKKDDRRETILNTNFLSEDKSMIDDLNTTMNKDSFIHPISRPSARQQDRNKINLNTTI